jgi:hypothetical protein
MLTSAAIVVFVLFFFFIGRLPNFFFGEDFFVFHWGETHNYLDAIRNWYEVNGRIGDAIYWMTEYKIIGYQPNVIHMISFFQYLIATLFAAVAIWRIWPKHLLKVYVIPSFIFISFFFCTGNELVTATGK